jgi:hypothetical protein
MILQHMTMFGDAYVRYLARVAIPHVLGHDPTFGHRYEELRRNLGHRIETVTEPRTRHAALDLLDRIPAGATHA